MQKEMPTCYPIGITPYDGIKKRFWAILDMPYTVVP